MITMQDALTAREFWHVSMKNADGTPMRARKNGATKTWKTRPTAFRVPCKHGLRNCFYIGTDTGLGYQRPEDWCVPERWEAEHVLFSKE